MPAAEEKKTWLPNPREGEHVFGVAHIFASFNDTFVVRNLSMSFHRVGEFAANPKIPLTLLAKPNPIPTSFAQLSMSPIFPGRRRSYA